MPCNAAIFREFLEAFPSNRPRSIAMLSENAVMIIPYLPDGFETTRLEGRSAIAPVFMMAYQLYKDFKWLSLEVFSTNDPSLCFATASSEAYLKDGSRYANSYCLLGRIAEGFVTEFTEFFDPRPIIRALLL